MESLVLRLLPSQKSLLSAEFRYNCVFVGTSSFRKLTEKGYESISCTLGLRSLDFIKELRFSSFTNFCSYKTLTFLSYNHF